MQQKRKKETSKKKLCSDINLHLQSHNLKMQLLKHSGGWGMGDGGWANHKLWQKPNFKQRKIFEKSMDFVNKYFAYRANIEAKLTSSQI